MGAEQAIRAAEAETVIEDDGPVRHLITVDEFLILDEAGAFEDVGRIELLDGEMFVMSPLHLPHGRTQKALIVAFDQALTDAFAGLELVAPVSARLDEHNLPEADLIVAATTDEEWVSRGATRILVEVSVSSLRHDLGRKARLYARTGVPEYWVADVNGRKIIRMAAPTGDKYTRRDEFAFGEAIPSATIEGLVVDTARLA